MKRLQNTTGLKVKVLPATNTKGYRVSIQQTNNRKRIVIPFPINSENTTDIVEFILNSIPQVTSFSLLVDNTQNENYLFVIDSEGTQFPDLIVEIKKIKF